MVRLFHVYFPARMLLLVLSEGALVFTALLAATFARFGFDAELALRYEYGLQKSLIACVVFMLCMHYYDLYDSLVLRNAQALISRLIQVLGTVCLLLALLYYAYPQVQLSRGPFLIWILLSGVLLAGWRRLFLAVNRAVRLSQKAVLVGDGPLLPALGTEIESRPELGLKLVGYVSAAPEHSADSNGLACLGGVETLPALVRQEEIRQIIVTMDDRRGRLPVSMLLRLKANGVVVKEAADIYEAVTGRVSLDALRPSWLLFSDGFHVSRAMLLYKRAASVVLSVIGLAVSLPVMALVALAIRWDSGPPVIFRQKRVGRDGRPFVIFKFRTMRVGADADENFQPALESDHRVTRVGRWLRRLHLDELPQLYNILRGDMYFIGPRPFTPNMEERYAQEIPFYPQRWTVKPGATGWAQIRRGYCASLEDNIEKLGYDLFYIKNLSLGLDCVIFFQTIKILLLGRGGR